MWAIILKALLPFLIKLIAAAVENNMMKKEQEKAALKLIDEMTKDESMSVKARKTYQGLRDRLRDRYQEFE